MDPFLVLWPWLTVEEPGTDPQRTMLMYSNQTKGTIAYCELRVELVRVISSISAIVASRSLFI